VQLNFVCSMATLRHYIMCLSTRRYASNAVSRQPLVMRCGRWQGLGAAHCSLFVLGSHLSGVVDADRGRLLPHVRIEAVSDGLL